MSQYPSHDEHGNCIFCKIVKGEISSPGIFRQDDEFMAFLSIFPNTEGFTVLIPKKHYHSDCLLLPDDVLSKFILAAKKVSKILTTTFPDVGRVGLIMEGTGIDHAHIKLFPMHGTEHLKKGERVQHESSIDTYFDKYVGYISSNDGPRADDEDIRKLAEKLKETQLYTL